MKKISCKSCRFRGFGGSSKKECGHPDLKGLYRDVSSYAYKSGNTVSDAPIFCPIVLRVGPGDHVFKNLVSQEALDRRANEVIDMQSMMALPPINDPVNPKHYTSLKISPLEYIKANNLGWNAGNVIKYVSRYKMKNGLDDLKKAKWYLEDLIKDVEAGK